VLPSLSAKVGAFAAGAGMEGRAWDGHAPVAEGAWSDKLYVADMLKRLSATDFATQEGTLYPLLSRMRREDLVDYEWKESDAGPPRKYYQLTAKGRTALAELTAYWNTLNSTITQLGR